MFNIKYKASYQAINRSEQGYFTIHLPEPINIPARSSIKISLPIDILLPDGWDCDYSINPVLDNPPLLACNAPYNMAYNTTLFNPTNEDLFYDADKELFRLIFYKQSIVLSGVSYDQKSNQCSFSFDQLESSYVRVPDNHIVVEIVNE